MRRLALLLCVPLIAATPATRRKATPDPLGATLAQIRPEILSAHVRFLADDALEGRGTGTRGYEAAAAYVASQFEAIGLEPAGDDAGWLQRVPFRRVQIAESECSLSLLRDGRERALQYGVDYLMPGDYLREQRTVSSPVVFAGYGVTAPELGWDDYAGVDVRGKLVVLLSGAPKSFAHDERAYHSWGQRKDQNAAAHGALGILTVRTPVDEARSTWERSLRQNRLPSLRWVDAGGAPHDVYPQLEMAATLSRATATALFEGSARTLEQVFAAADTGRVAPFELATQVRARRVTRQTPASSPNVIGLLRGSDPTLRNQYVVYSAHLDHLGVSTPVNGDSINNGAYDNATGIATLIEAARAFRRLPTAPKRSILFIAVTGEEKGSQGSDYFAQHPTVPAGSLVADVNLDMYLMLERVRRVIVFGAEHSSLGEVAEHAARSEGLEVVPDPHPEEVIFIRSDQFSFVREGIPSVFPVSNSDRNADWLKTNYHSPQDDLRQTFDWESGVTFTKFNVRIGNAVANAAGRPTWTPGDFFGRTFASAGVTARP